MPSTLKISIPEYVDFELDYNEALFEFIEANSKLSLDAHEIISTVSGRRAVVIHNPQLIKHILQGNHKNYSKGLGIDKIRILLGNGIMASEGEHWLKQRRIMQPCFHRSALKTFADKIIALNANMISDWRGRPNQEINLNEEMSKLSLNVILSAIFSDSLMDQLQSGSSPFHILTEETVRDLKFARKFRSLHQYISEILNDRITRSYWPSDFLTFISQARQKDTGAQMSLKELCDEIITLIVAGHETTASTLTWCWYLLTKHPVIYEKLISEVQTANVSTYEDIMQLSMPKQVIQETMRLYPAGWLISRRAKADDQYGGYTISKGMDVLISLYSLHRNSDAFSESDEFKPERFSTLSDHEDTHYLPFSTGPRKCIGDAFSLLEMQINLVMVSTALRLANVKNIKADMEPHINLRPRNTLHLQTNPI